MTRQALEQVEIGGVKQWVLIRGQSQCPILLILHGGPGSANIAVAGSYQQSLEQHFLVVNWDQRGAGKSCCQGASALSIQQLVSDAGELIRLLLKRFGKRKLYVLGHSWGSALGLLVTYQDPELVQGYIGVGQLVNGLENERLAFEHTQDRACQANNRLAIFQLRRSRPPPYGGNIGALLIQRTWLYWFRGFLYHRKEALRYALTFLSARTYSFQDKVRYYHNLGSSLRQLWPEVESVNLCRDVPRVHVPVLFCLGRHDMTTPASLAEHYFEVLEAPSKRLIWFASSAHCPHLEEPHAFAETVFDWAKQVSEQGKQK